MKELKNGIKIIGIDHGYGNIKTASTVTPTGITASSTEPVFAGNILHYDGMYYRMGDRNAIASSATPQFVSTDGIFVVNIGGEAESL